MDGGQGQGRALATESDDPRGLGEGRCICCAGLLGAAGFCLSLAATTKCTRVQDVRECVPWSPRPPGVLEPPEVSAASSVWAGVLAPGQLGLSCTQLS